MGKLTIVGNWKMNGSKQQVSDFFARLQNELSQKTQMSCDIVICPPFVYIPQVVACVKNIPQVKVGAQDVSAHYEGAYTGQVSASMLAELGCEYVILGHSERRQFCNETDHEIAQKFFTAKELGLIPILCVGETGDQRKDNLTQKVVTDQLKPILAKQGASAFDGAMIAYEPIWAIGTGLTATPEQAQAVHCLLREAIAEYDATLAKKIPILYGGSVKANNATALLGMQDINGALVGGASLKVEDFLGICSNSS